MQLEPFEKDEPETWNAVAWRLLARACQDSTSSLRHPVVSTHGALGPQARVVLLRAVDPQRRILTLYTDARSPKVADLNADPRMAWTFWDERLRLQLRVRSTATVHHNDARAAAVRTQVPEHAWRDYTSLAAPGESVAQQEHDPALFTKNFCVIDAQVLAMDILALRASRAGGHKRLHIDYASGHQDWVVP
ncbi:MAG: pyridoxamine 5'-phosphate oxidase family protein [Burkholderiaceae bacterium]